MSHEIQAFTTWERMAMSIALRLVKKHQTFHPHPTADRNGVTLIGWLRNLGKRGISQQAGTQMLNEDLNDTMQALRARIFSIGHERLGEARGAALLFLAMLPELGADKVLAWDDMWGHLSRSEWEEAAEALQMTGFAAAMAGTLQERARAVALQRVLRTGKQFGPDDEKRLEGMALQ
ncbi:MAG: hypothetical protein ACREO0_15115 [Pseudoxanthomonas sp.]